MTGNVMEITAPRGSIRLVAFPTFEEFPQHYPFPLINRPYRRRMTEGEKLDYYSKKRHKAYRQQCQGVRAFMRQHKGRNGHNREAV